MNNKPAGKFGVDVDRESIRTFYNVLRSYSESPELIVKFNQHINNIECLIADNLADGLKDIVLPSAALTK
ncbi:MAG: hypothetical protein R2932_42430 [Caldilineaceae bacterium]